MASGKAQAWAGWIQAGAALAALVGGIVIASATVSNRVSTTEAELGRLRDKVESLEQQVNQQALWRAATEQVLRNLTERIHASLGSRDYRGTGGGGIR